MAPRKWDKFKEWLSIRLAPDSEIRYTPDGLQYHAGPGGFFGRARGVSVHNSPMTAVQGNQYTTYVREETYVQGDRNIVPQIMKILSDRIIQDAAHNSSARTPPPRCHPNTRVRLIARITSWFEGEDVQELLLWITGPAGVGKSAVVQTFAEFLANSKSLGASLFISSPNGRNNPHGVFITIAYQLATRIQAYRDFIVERLSLDPELLHGHMGAQFMTFIVEPFVEKRIGAGGKRWGILLDGLDELKGEDAQCNIIQLISNFTHEHPDAPLLWIIASRPESHILNTFDDDDVRRSYWSEYIPIDSTEACEDVDRFLRSSFKAIQKKFRQSVPSDWPSDTDFLKLTVAASGLFVYAEVVMEFIRDPDRGDPFSQLKILLSIIDRSTAVPTKDNPFVHLDALYYEILSSIPSALWPTAKLLLGFLIQDHGHVMFDLIHQYFRSLKATSILFSLTQHSIYASIIKCRSTLKIPDWRVAHKEGLTVLHASFSDYLKDPSRSGNFHVGNVMDVQDRAVLNLLEIWNKCSGDGVAGASVEATWQQYCSEWDGTTPSKAVARFHAKLFSGVITCLGLVGYHVKEWSAESPIYAELRKVHMAKLCYYFRSDDLRRYVWYLGELPGLDDLGLYRETQLRGLKFGHLDWEEMSPANAHNRRRGMLSKEGWIIRRPRSSAELKTFVSELELLQEQSPELKVVIFGGVPKWRVAVFQCGQENERESYMIPYPES